MDKTDKKIRLLAIIMICIIAILCAIDLIFGIHWLILVAAFLLPIHLLIGITIVSKAYPDHKEK